ncbi:hypothetical protein ABB02_00728 [Clostridiaceae bacterium JG1575]|nr:hypothetical protein ABB02_00728 [Clostridiaceae bacterium JG1575]
MNRYKRTKGKKIAAAAFLALLMIGFVAYPLLHLIWSSFQGAQGEWTLRNYQTILRTDSTRRAIGNTLWLGALSVLGTVALGTWLALAMNYLKSTGEGVRRVLRVLFMAPFLIPGVILVLSFLQLFGEVGFLSALIRRATHGLFSPVLQGLPGILFVHVFTQYVYAYMNVSLALRSLDAGAVEAAKNLGAGRRAVFFDVLWPHIRPAVLASALLSFFAAISSFSAPALLGGSYRVISTQVLQYKLNHKLPLATSLVTLLLALGILVILSHQALQQERLKSRSGRTTSLQRVPFQSKIARHLHRILLFSAAFFIALPVIAVGYLSFVPAKSLMMDLLPQGVTWANYQAVFSAPRVLAPLKNSLQMALWATAVSLGLAGSGAYLAARAPKKSAAFFRFVFLLPMAIPASTLGIVLITAFAQGTLFTFGQSLLGTWFLLPIAYVLQNISLVYQNALTSLTGFNRELSFASDLLGARQRTTLLRIVGPAVAPGFLYGGVVCFLRSLGEYTVSSLLYGITNRPVSIAMVNALHDYDVGVSMVYGSIIIFLGAGVLIVLEARGRLP